MRIAVIDYDKCDPNKCGWQCINVCPINRKGETCIGKDMVTINGSARELPVITESLCIGCGLCVKKCPKRAIKIVNTPERLKTRPIHRYGKNGFVLFRLPIPKKGVVGLLGSNGVGKTTALKILSGELKPNLGSADVEWNEIINIHKGTELFNYMKKLSDGNIKAVYKPQQVDKIPNVLSGKVSDLLPNVSDEMKAKLNLTKILDRDIKNLSGGELQRVAIAAALSKEGDIYYFDEPTSYLDVKERLNVAKLIREKSSSSPVMVVEHDLATLDFLADTIHIFYGEPGAFGIVSKPYTVKNGINAFLDGYIKGDNVRIRDPIVFERFQSMKKRNDILVEFTDIKKSFDGFELHVDGGAIYKGHVLGILGANGLGKTTFVKILAGLYEFDGSISKQVKVSYKPQFIFSKYNGSVLSILSEINPYSTEVMNTIIKPLGVDRLFEKKVSSLSGGELQRVAIAMCMGRKADLYLLDEPCAYLDVEQRIALAKLIRNSDKTFVIIDHDLLFLNYISDETMLFTGEQSKFGRAKTMSLKDGMNEFLKEIGVTFRKDPETNRPRANKPGSQKDTEQKSKGVYYEA